MCFLYPQLEEAFATLLDIYGLKAGNEARKVMQKILVAHVMVVLEPIVEGSEGFAVRPRILSAHVANLTPHTSGFYVVDPGGSKFPSGGDEVRMVDGIADLGEQGSLARQCEVTRMRLPLELYTDAALVWLVLNVWDFARPISALLRKWSQRLTNDFEGSIVCAVLEFEVIAKHRSRYSCVWSLELLTLFPGHELSVERITDGLMKVDVDREGHLPGNVCSVIGAVEEPANWEGPPQSIAAVSLKSSCQRVFASQVAQQVERIQQIALSGCVRPVQEDESRQVAQLYVL